jgi:transcriptional regulator with XRE-family HTH domain
VDHPTENIEFGRNLLILRKKKSLTQEGLGELIKVSGAQIGRYEKGMERPRHDKLTKLAKALDVKVPELLGYESTENITSGRESVRETVQPPVRNGRHQIPFFDTIAVGGTEVLADQSAVQGPSDMIYPGSLLATATGALRIYGHSMFPKYPAGCVVAYRDADKDVIIWGEDYVIELSDRRIIKRLEKSAKADCVSAVSYNKSEDYVYAAIDIPLVKIKRLYMVVGKVELEASV